MAIQRLFEGWDRTVRDPEGLPVDGAEIDVRVAKDPQDEDAGTIQRPTLYADAYGDTSKANPFTTPTNGRAVFYVEQGVYHVVLTTPGAKRVYRNVQIGQGPEAYRRIRSVVSRTNGGPPSSPNLDDAYIVDDASGDWSGFSVNDIALYQSGVWWAFTPEPGHGPVWVDDEAVKVQANSSGYETVLTDSSAVPRIATGTFTGDGNASQSITGLGFQPKFLEIYRRETSNDTGTQVFRTTPEIIDDIAGGAAHRIASSTNAIQSTIQADAITSLDADGFTVGSKVNDSNQDYNYWALG